MSDTSGFHVYALDHAQHIRTIRQRLLEIRQTRAADLIAGFVADWADYKKRVGILEGLDEALHVCDEVERAERAGGMNETRSKGHR